MDWNEENSKNDEFHVWINLMQLVNVLLARFCDPLAYSHMLLTTNRIVLML
jgi:hypothetical protein